MLRNPQLVNGAQTAYTLGRIYEQCATEKEFNVFKGKEVLLKIITFVGSNKRSQEHLRVDLIGAISKASNSQTKVEESDRRSNDPVQIDLQTKLFENYGLYYERKRGEFSDGLHLHYLLPQLVVNREKLVRVSLACDYRTSQARSSIAKYFKEGAIEKLLKVTDADRYAFGYEVLELLGKQKKNKPKTKGDRYHTKEFGQALRYGLYAVVAACTNKGIAAQKTEAHAVNAILSQWLKFEEWAEKQPANATYKSGTSFDHVNYYKGSTINDDLRNYPFTV